MLIAVKDAARHRRYSGRLIALRFVRTNQPEFHDNCARLEAFAKRSRALTEENFSGWASLHYTTEVVHQPPYDGSAYARTKRSDFSLLATDMPCPGEKSFQLL